MAALSKLLGAMDARPKEAGIATFALRQTSMEEVFLSIALAAEQEQQKEREGAPKKSDAVAPPAKAKAGARAVEMAEA